MDEHKVAVVGCGKHVVETLSKVVRDISGVRVLCCVDKQIDKAVEMAYFFGVDECAKI